VFVSRGYGDTLEFIKRYKLLNLRPYIINIDYDRLRNLFVFNVSGVRKDRKNAKFFQKLFGKWMIAGCLSTFFLIR